MALLLKLRGVRTSRLVQLFVALQALLGSVVSAIAPSSFEDKVIWIAGFLVLGLLVVVMVILDTARTERDQQRLNADIEELQKAAADGARFHAENNELQKQVLKLTELNTTLAEEAKQATTGGDSFCYANANFQFEKPFFIIIQSGKYPVYDVSVRIVDMTERTSLAEAGKIVGESTFNVLNVGGAAQGPDFPEPFTGPSLRRFNIVFIARNGTWHQNLVVCKGNMRWSWALRVWPKKTNPPTRGQMPVFQHVDNDFPRNSAGDVDWW
jgi:hypothetical protein